MFFTYLTCTVDYKSYGTTTGTVRRYGTYLKDEDKYKNEYKNDDEDNDDADKDYVVR